MLDASSTGGLPRNIVLYRGMKVMLTANLCLRQGLDNGSTGIVVAIVYINNLYISMDTVNQLVAVVHDAMDRQDQQEGYLYCVKFNII